MTIGKKQEIDPIAAPFHSACKSFRLRLLSGESSADSTVAFELIAAKRAIFGIRFDWRFLSRSSEVPPAQRYRRS